MTSNRSVRLVDDAGTFGQLRAAERAAIVERDSLAAKTVAAHSKDATECAELLAMLGLDLTELT